MQPPLMWVSKQFCSPLFGNNNRIVCNRTLGYTTVGDIHILKKGRKTLRIVLLSCDYSLII
jgi:hypothetical protein